MRSAEIIDLINALEEEYPVDRWTIDDVRVWPLIRVRLGFQLFYALETTSSEAQKTYSLLLRVSKMLGGLGRCSIAKIRDWKMNAAPNKVNAVFLSDGVSFAQINGNWIEKFCDPFISRFHAHGLSSFMMCPADLYPVPRHTPSQFIQPRLDLSTLGSLLGPKGNIISLTGFNDCRESWKSRGFTVDFPSLALLKRIVARQASFTEYFVSVLERTTPGVAFVVSYHGLEGMAFNTACRSLGIPSVDIQHGVQGIHYPYGRWNKLPVDGYAQLPRFFWCWSEAEATAIRKWSNPLVTFHQPLIGGSLWLREWQNGSADEVIEYDRKVKDIKESVPGKHVLLTLQFGMTNSEGLQTALQTIKHSPVDWLWWIRLHPCMLEERSRIKRLLRENRISDSLVDVATDMPLFAILKQMDAHLTHSSTTVIEAADFGVPSVVISDLGEKLFPEQVSTGICVSAFNSQDAIEALTSQIGKSGMFRRSAVPIVREELEAMDLLLKLARKEQAL